MTANISTHAFVFLQGAFIPAGLLESEPKEGGGQRLHWSTAGTSELVTFLVTAHIRPPASLIPAIVKTSDPEQIWRDSELKELLLKRNHPEVAEKAWGD